MIWDIQRCSGAEALVQLERDGSARLLVDDGGAQADAVAEVDV
jgi:hypothetical protein